jgi:hypothetical protein
MKRIAKTPRYLRFWMILVGLLILTACATPPSIQKAKIAEGLLTPAYTISGARLISRTANTPNFFQQKSGPDYLSFISPSEVRVNGNYLYILDSGRRQLYQFDQAQQGMFLFANFPMATISSISVAPDFSVYAADTSSHSVFHFSADGKLLQTFSHARELARPVAVLVDYTAGQVIVADSLYNQIVIFNSLGRLQSVIRTTQTRSIAAMARGTGGLYLVDRLSRKIVEIGNDGVERSAFGSDRLKDPVAIAVDRYGRVFVGDNFDNTIKIYENGLWRETFGGTGATPGRFNRGNSLWIERDMLYVADSLNARIQVFRIAPSGAN